MAATGTDAQIVPPYEGECEPTDESPTAHLRHLKEISYILEKLQSNRTRFLLAAAHRRRQHFGSFAAKQRHEPENPHVLEFATPRQIEEGYEVDTNLHDEFLFRRSRQHRQHQRQEGQESTPQEHRRQDRFSLDGESQSETRSAGSLCDVPPTSEVHTNAYCEAEAPNYGERVAVKTAAASEPDLEAAQTYFCQGGSSNYGTNATTAAPAARDDRGTVPHAANWSALLAPATATAKETEAKTTLQCMGSFTSRRESVLQRAPVTLQGDDVDLYLGELLVPLLHDGLVDLCRLVELKQKDRTKQRLGLAFHEHFDPLRWLGQYLIRHHPKNGAAYAGYTAVAVAAAPLSGSPRKCQWEDSVSAAVPDQNNWTPRAEAGSAGPRATADETWATAEAVEPAASAATTEAVTHSSTAEAAHALTNAGQSRTRTAVLTVATAALAGAADSTATGGTASSADVQTRTAAPVSLPAATTVAVSGTATGNEEAASEGNAEAQTAVPDAAQGHETSCNYKLESLHKRRMQQHASFYGVLKDIADEERSRRDFLLRREEVKQIFETYCREKNDPRSGCKSSRGSCLNLASEFWGKRLSLSLRRRSSIATERLLAFAAADGGGPHSPRKFRAPSETRLSETCVAPAAVVAAAATTTTGAAEGDATPAEPAPTDGEASEETAPRTQTGEMVDTARGAIEQRAKGGSTGVSPRPRRCSREKFPCGEVGEGVSGFEEETRRDASSKAVGEVAASGATDGTDEGGVFGCIPVSVEDFQDILERLDAHWELGGRLLTVFQEGLPIHIATEHADLIQYLLPEQDRELVIEDPEDVQADEFWAFVKCYAEVHTWIRRELYNRRKQQLHVKPAANNQQKLVGLLVKKKMVTVQQREDEDEDVSQIEGTGREKYANRRDSLNS